MAQLEITPEEFENASPDSSPVKQAIIEALRTGKVLSRLGLQEQLGRKLNFNVLSKMVEAGVLEVRKHGGANFYRLVEAAATPTKTRKA